LDVDTRIKELEQQDKSIPVDENGVPEPIYQRVLLEKLFDTDQLEQQVTYKELQAANIMLVKEQIREVSEIASKEKGFEKQLYTMKGKWKPMKLELVDFKDTETYILKNIDPILDQLDEDIAKTLSIASSPYVKFMEKEVLAWKEQLFKLQDTIDLWLKTQKMWCYL
jgi:dynein heavy chain, axonemal